MLDIRGRINLPNVLSLLRLLGTPALYWLVQLESPVWFIAWFMFLGLTDFFDGLLARRYGLVSSFGSMLDSIADIAFFGSAAVLAISLFPDYVLPNLPWVIATVGLLLMAGLLPRLRLGHFLFIHTHLSRLAAALVFFALPASFLIDTTGLIRLILIIYSLAFIESIWIILRHGSVDPDTRSFLSARSKPTALS
ncbi:MAG: CDP-alcohol phosphatidyltransferase family protein [Wenzhouxiangella sp.]|nr:CDP-alcohol phosphatidyltransferase family protein [Wenzhouxiangella sp.]MCH8477411.1 CDP-alcohol phosphatidyltransferase family protein [Wenzhouxiangella sp.]TVR97408.1 MAG: CDP-alcohol phosphatidyltransferase family protein [Wenzhouxiangellaceae bacterium]